MGLRSIDPRQRRLLALWVAAIISLAFSYCVVVYELSATTRDIDRIEGVLQSEKVCSEHNQGLACQALFDRLARNLTPAQRFRLACDVLAALDSPQAASLRDSSRCPAPIKSP